MNPYELLAIVPAIFTDDEIGAITEKLSGMVSATGAKLVRTQNLGKLKLAYPIKQNKHGVYVLVQFDAEPSVVNKLDADLRLTDNVIRHLITDRPAGAETRNYVVEAYQPPISEEGMRMRGNDRKRAGGKSDEAPTASAPVKRGPDMTIEELDKKLDQILDGAEENV